MQAQGTTLPLIDGRFRLLRLLASGGMGELYLAIAQDAEIEGLEQLVVMKRILPEFASDRAVVTMFLIEARIAARLDHPNVVRVHHMGRAGGSLYFTMEYLHGADLGRLFDAARTRGGFPLGHAITILIGVCAGLHFAHEVCRVDGRPLGIVHRDVSPGNVFVTFEGEIKVVDFGIAKVLTPKRVTRDGMRKGKLAYMSPEQVRDEPVDRRSDIYAIGILLYELVTMSHLFDGDNEYEIMKQITTGQFPRPSERKPGVPPALERIILKALSLDREDRHEHALELAEELVAFAQQHKVRISTLALKPFLKRMIGEVEYPWYLDEEGPEEAAAVQTWFASAQPEDAEETTEVDVSLSGLFEVEDDLDELGELDELDELDEVDRSDRSDRSEARGVVQAAPVKRPAVAPGWRGMSRRRVAGVAAIGVAGALLAWRCRQSEAPEEPGPAPAVAPALPPPVVAPAVPVPVAVEAAAPVSPEPPVPAKKAKRKRVKASAAR